VFSVLTEGNFARREIDVIFRSVPIRENGE